MEPSQDRRVSTFPRTNVGQKPSTKRAFETSNIRDPNVGHGKLRKSAAKDTESVQRKEADPWQQYQRLYKLNLAGQGFVIHRKDSTFSEYFSKEVKVNRKEWLSRITQVSHKNIVILHESLYHDGNIYFIYELMDVYLSQIFSTPFGRLKAYEVASWCHEVLEGIEYIHQTLGFAHGDVNSENVLLTMSGSIKIANIGICMLQNIGQDRAQNDIRSVGRMVIECLEPSTFYRKGESLTLGPWDPTLSKFVEHTKSWSIYDILQHDFLKLSPGPNCLKPYIRLARDTMVGTVEVGEAIA
ncbi:STYKc [Aspergillus sclerotialis]|uniref:STYKc n=1 Tax=Aspergillus sclerotialis TaxID=2070753 RepID=A0A3A2Z7X3_9EURO|nr:STYKc [Aspergillus sclerotialis]